MPERLSQNLSPQAKKQLLTSEDGTVVRVMAELGPSADQTRIRDDVVQLGGEVRSWSSESRLLVLEIPTDSLDRLARLNGVVYVESAQPYRS
jgi:hypothetical protein